MPIKNESISYLQKKSLWIIMDPWHPTPYSKDIEIFPKIDEYNQITFKKILNYIPKLKYVCISCPTFILDNNVPKLVTPHPEVSHLLNLKNNYLNLITHMKTINLNDIVYCGFHYGKCILDKPDGVRNASKLYKVWVKKDLCCYLPDLPICEYDKLTEQYSTII
jgi:hypothetical protein